RRRKRIEERSSAMENEKEGKKVDGERKRRRCAIL
ncbi:hypothetical protein CISIN_1g0446442mg, partial [Citrus sinensis]